MQYCLTLLCCLFLSGCVSLGTGSITPQVNSTIKVLTINLCADWEHPRSDRAERIIDLIRKEKVDIILFQEGIKGVTQVDMAKYIAEKLGYSYCQAPTFGVAGFMEFCIGMITAYPMKFITSVGCQVEGGDVIDKVPFPGSTRGIRAVVNGVTVMSCHLTVPVTQERKSEQINCLMSGLPKEGRVIWGGDFNMDRSDPAYNQISLQEAIPPGRPQIDMIFTRGFTVLNSRLVFEDHFISDHVGILVELQR